MTDESLPVTIIHHNREGNLTLGGYTTENSGSLPVPLSYNLSIDQIRSVVTSATNCSYHISIDCHGMKMSQYSYFKSYVGESVTDWTASSSSICQLASQGMYSYF